MSAPTRPGEVHATFTGEADRFFGLVVRGSLMQLLTFGFYRFWLLTDIRRHLWSNTRIGEESFEYTGRAVELLIGFLIALAIVLPINIAYFWLALEAEGQQTFASIPLVLLLYVLAQYATFRARRYRATRTMFRGIRFWMTGSAWTYAGRAILWDLLTAVTLGLAYPWRAAALERYKMQNTYYGDLQGSFAGSGWTFFKRGIWIWLVGLLLYVAAIVVGVIMAVATTPSPASQQIAAGIMTVAILAAFAVIGLLLWPLFMATEWRWRLEGLRFGPVAVSSALRKGSVLGRYLATIALVIVFLIVLGVVFAVLAWAFGAAVMFEQPGTSPPPVSFIVGAVLFYLVAILGVGAIKLQIFDRGLWKIAVNSLALSEIAALDAVTAKGEAAGNVDAGLADALDIGGI